MRSSILSFCSMLAVALAGLAQAADLVITSYTGNGEVQWTYPTNGLESYRIEWASNLATAKWTDLEQGLCNLALTSAAMTAEVPMFYRIMAMGAPPTNMVYVPPGTFRMGDTFSDGGTDELPVHNVYISGFYMDRCEVTKALWDEVATWASANGYDIAASGGSGKATNHPVQMVNWYEAVKWCNARSEKDGLSPCYRYILINPIRVVVYRTGTNDLSSFWSYNGYRLPTEAEWEKAARGGASGSRFPWADNTISHGRANYDAAGGESYDLSNGAGIHPDYKTGGAPFTSPVGAFMASGGYGLYDMAGNIFEWCWDWYQSNYYETSTAVDPFGPVSGTTRVLRGGSSGYWAFGLRCADRYYVVPNFENVNFGFRCARRP